MQNKYQWLCFFVLYVFCRATVTQKVHFKFLNNWLSISLDKLVKNKQNFGDNNSKWKLSLKNAKSVLLWIFKFFSGFFNIFWQPFKKSNITDNNYKYSLNYLRLQNSFCQSTKLVLSRYIYNFLLYINRTLPF